MVEIVGIDERVVLDRLKGNLRMAAENVGRLSSFPFRGLIWVATRRQLRDVAEDCRAVGHLRGGDSRWLTVAYMVDEASERAGRNVHNSVSKAQRVAMHPFFVRLGEILLALHVKIIELETKATGTSGPILPPVLQDPGVRHHPVAFTRPSGLIIPAGISDVR